MSILKKMTDPLIFQIIPVNERDADPSEYDLNRFFRSIEQEMNMVAHDRLDPKGHCGDLILSPTTQ